MRVYLNGCGRDLARVILGGYKFADLTMALNKQAWVGTGPALTWHHSNHPPWTEEASK